MVCVMVYSKLSATCNAYEMFTLSLYHMAKRTAYKLFECDVRE